MTGNLDQIENLNYEAAFEKLESLLERMSQENVGLEESLLLYEEASKLVKICSTKLNDAEKKIEILSKNQSGELLVDDNGNPVKESYS